MTSKNAKDNIWYAMKNAIFLVVHFSMSEHLHENHKTHIMPYYGLSHEMRVVNNIEKKISCKSKH